jgi:signal transduction histidine kinase
MGPSEKHNQCEQNQDNSGSAHREGLVDLARLIETLPVAVVTFNAALLITAANERARGLMDVKGPIETALTMMTRTQDSPAIDWHQVLSGVLAAGKSQCIENAKCLVAGRQMLLRVLCCPCEFDQNRGGVVILDDVTEDATLKRQLTEAERFAALGRLAAKVAHELNNPLDGILRYMNLAERAVQQTIPDKATEYLQRCRQGLMRMVHIVGELLEFSRNSYGEFEYVRVEDIIEDAIRTMQPAADAANVKVVRNYAAGIEEIRSGNLFQVFCNLIKNAVEAMEQGGTLAVSTHLAPDRTVMVEFRDTGPGFPPEHAETIFEPFFTTKGRTRGTGLGLAICRDIIERYPGRITAKNAPEGGSIFTIIITLSGHET